MAQRVQQVQVLSQRVVQTYSWGVAVWHVWGSQISAQASSLDTEVATPLVLLHGGSGSWTHWVRNVEHLSRHRSVWVLDLPGFGDSSLPPGVVDADGLVPYLAEIFQASFLGCAVDVLAFSFGGMTAGLMAAEQPALIRELVLIGVPGLGLFGKSLPMRGMTPDMDEAAKRHVHRHNLNTMMFAHADSVTDDVINLQQANVARDRMRRRRIARTDVLAKAQTRWTCPVHGVWGERDALYEGTLAQVPTVLHRLVTFTVIPDAGHWLMYERPDAFHAAIEPLLRKK